MGTQLQCPECEGKRFEEPQEWYYDAEYVVECSNCSHKIRISVVP